MKVMIVDDEPIGRDSLQALLTSCDFDVCAAANGPQAIDIAKQTELDVALIDWMLSDETDGAMASRVAQLVRSACEGDAAFVHPAAQDIAQKKRAGCPAFDFRSGVRGLPPPEI